MVVVSLHGALDCGMAIPRVQMSIPEPLHRRLRALADERHTTLIGLLRLMADQLEDGTTEACGADSAGRR